MLEGAKPTLRPFEIIGPPETVGHFLCGPQYRQNCQTQAGMRVLARAGTLPPSGLFRGKRVARPSTKYQTRDATCQWQSWHRQRVGSGGIDKGRTVALWKPHKPIPGIRGYARQLFESRIIDLLGISFPTFPSRGYGESEGIKKGNSGE